MTRHGIYLKEDPLSGFLEKKGGCTTSCQLGAKKPQVGHILLLQHLLANE
jgi:hypothetical protein